MLAGGESNVRRSMPKSDSARGKVEVMSRSCSRSLSSGDHRWTESGRKTTTIPANPASVTATCAAMPRASLGCIATIKGEHGQEIKAQIHALEEERRPLDDVLDFHPPRISEQTHHGCRRSRVLRR